MTDEKLERAKHLKAQMEEYEAFFHIAERYVPEYIIQAHSPSGGTVNIHISCKAMEAISRLYLEKEYIRLKREYEEL